MSVHIVILNWNGLLDTQECLQGLEDLCKASDAPKVVVHVADNGSTDGSLAVLRKAFSWVNFHEHGRNLGFSRGVNEVLRTLINDSSMTHVLLLNNDARLLPNTLPQLLEASRRWDDKALVGPRIFEDIDADRLWSCGVLMGWWPNLCRLRGQGELGAGRYLQEEQVESLTGCVLLIPSAVLRTVGLLDERFFVYGEDTEYCARAAKAQVPCIYTPDAVCEHRPAGSTGGGYSVGRKYLSAHGAVLFLKRHGTLKLWLGWLILDVAFWLPLLVLNSLRGRGRSTLAKGRGMLDALLGRDARAYFEQASLQTKEVAQ